jgi:hypothetical protein
MTAGTFNITLEQGADLAITAVLNDFSGSPINLTGWTATLMIRQAFADPSSIVTLTNGSGITLGGPAGTIYIDFTGDLTSALNPGQALYDLKLIDANAIPYRPLQGSVTIVGAITR